jgi:hypothetical protein
LCDAVLRIRSCKTFSESHPLQELFYLHSFTPFSRLLQVQDRAHFL